MERAPCNNCQFCRSRSRKNPGDPASLNMLMECCQPVSKSGFEKLFDKSGLSSKEGFIKPHDRPLFSGAKERVKKVFEDENRTGFKNFLESSKKRGRDISQLKDKYEDYFVNPYLRKNNPDLSRPSSRASTSSASSNDSRTTVIENKYTKGFKDSFFDDDRKEKSKSSGFDSNASASKDSSLFGAKPKTSKDKGSGSK